MKQKVIYSVLLVLALLFGSCSDKRQRIQTLNIPVYLSYSELRQPVSSSQPVSLQKPGKIYIKPPFIFINEYLKGIHVIDNSDPGNPQFVSFIDIPGNIDIAVRGSILYADSYVDLLSLDISDPQNITEAGRAMGMLPYVIPPTDNDYDIDWEAVNETKGVITGWKVEKVKKDIEYNPWPYPPYFVVNDFLYKSGSFAGSSSGNGGNSAGTGGSMARFTLAQDYLWVLTQNDLRTIDISDPQNMFKKSVIYLVGNMETIFPYDHYLFLGSQTGMTIYDISDPLAPELISRYNHWQSCDPVVVHNNVAYITLRSGDRCGTTVNRMDVVDLSDLSLPVLQMTYPMQNPHGLAINDSLLYVCEGKWGLKVYDATTPLAPVRIKTITDIQGWDAITLDDLLLVIGDDGLFQYRVNNLDDIQQISYIPVTNSN